MAFDCRQKPIIISKPKLPLPVSNTTGLEERYQGLEVLEFSNNPILDPSKYTQASTLLANESWCKTVKDYYRLDAENAVDRIEQSTLDFGDHLQKVLISRFGKHVLEKVPEDKQEDSWCLSLQVSKLGHLAAVMTLLSQVKDDLAVLGDHECLLKGPSAFREVIESLREDGGYGYWDDNNYKWVRIGMVALRIFFARGLEHKEGSLLKSTSIDGKFYTSHPDKSVADKVGKQRLGQHNNFCDRW